MIAGPLWPLLQYTRCGWLLPPGLGSSYLSSSTNFHYDNFLPTGWCLVWKSQQQNCIISAKWDSRHEHFISFVKLAQKPFQPSSSLSSSSERKNRRHTRKQKQHRSSLLLRPLATQVKVHLTPGHGCDQPASKSPSQSEDSWWWRGPSQGPQPNLAATRSRRAPGTAESLPPDKFPPLFP